MISNTSTGLIQITLFFHNFIEHTFANQSIIGINIRKLLVKGDFMSPAVLTDEEEQIVIAYMLLPYLRRALEVDRKAIFASGLKFKALYVDRLTDAIHKVTADMRLNKKEIFNLQMRFTRRTWLNYQIYVRGMIFEVNYHKNVALGWIHERVKDYFPQDLDILLNIEKQ